MGNELAQSGQARFELGHALRQVAEDTLSQTDTWLADVSRVLADPKAVLRERGLSTTGEVELDLTLSFRPSPTLQRLRCASEELASARKSRTSRIYWNIIITFLLLMMLSDLLFR